MDSEKEVHVRAMSAPHSLAPQDEECAAPGKNLRTAATIPQVEKSTSSDVSPLKSSFNTLASAAAEEIKEGPVGTHNLNETVHHSRSMERGE